ncbi:hypothetical protein NL533_34345, partial [Klebsiella pneumoniae]|nr:hypothetical protein [Klebsiella pneumoniae]
MDDSWKLRIRPQETAHPRMLRTFLRPFRQVFRKNLNLTKIITIIDNLNQTEVSQMEIQTAGPI